MVSKILPHSLHNLQMHQVATFDDLLILLAVPLPGIVEHLEESPNGHKPIAQDNRRDRKETIRGHYGQNHIVSAVSQCHVQRQVHENGKIGLRLSMPHDRCRQCFSPREQGLANVIDTRNYCNGGQESAEMTKSN